MAELNGKAVIVTGASSGIGAALAEAFSAAGARVTLTARRRRRLEQTAAACAGETLIVPADVTEPRGRLDIVNQTVARWGGIDILVNNAGLGAYGHFLDATEEEWRRLFEANFFASVFLTKAVLPLMLAQGGGMIINVASIGGLVAHSDKVTPYVASKHALVGFSRGLEKDLAGSGVRLVVVCPHLTDTEFFTVSPGAEEMAPVVAKYHSFMDTPQEVARGVVEQLDGAGLILFPTPKPALAFEKMRDI